MGFGNVERGSAVHELISNLVPRDTPANQERHALAISTFIGMQEKALACIQKMKQRQREEPESVIDADLAGA